MKKLFTSLLFVGALSSVCAQTNVTIQQIQEVSAANLAACVDSSSLKGQVVTTRGVVVTSYGLAQNGAGTSSMNNIWIQSGNGAWNGLDIFGSNNDPAAGVLQTLLQGDSIEITGTVAEFGPTGGPQVETELIAIQNINILGSGSAVSSQLITIGDLNDAAQANVLPTGEQWEGQFIELQNVTVTAVSYFANNTRVSFTVQDANGNLINVSDRFKCGKLPAANGTFIPPTVGTVYCSLKGIIIHSPNGCKNFNGRGYELHPFDASHYSVCAGSAYPTISAVSNSPTAPTSSQNVTVTATINDTDGTITSASLKYAVGATNTSYTTVAMSNGGSGNVYTATIPMQADGSFVKYYISAEDNDNLITVLPNVPGGNANPYAYVVRDNGLTIYDLQYTPFTDGNSIYKDKTVTVTGVVTASAEPGNLGYVFIQQEGGLLGWAGIMCLGNPQIANLVIGDKVTVSGVVKEDFGCTRLDNIASVAVNGTGTITPVQVNPTALATYDFATNEAYEGMLVKVKTAGKLFIIDQNADDPDNFAEYRVGADTLLPDNGARIIAGRQKSSAYSSLNVSYVNDSMWMTTDGVMNVPPIIVKVGDCMNSVTGIAYYSFSNMKVLPRNNADFDTYDDKCDGINQSLNDAFAKNSVISVYPSPAFDVLNVNYKFPYTSKVTITLFDLAGQSVAAQSVVGMEGASTFSTSTLAAGTYFLTVTSDNGLVYREKVSIVK